MVIIKVSDNDQIKLSEMDIDIKGLSKTIQTFIDDSQNKVITHITQGVSKEIYSTLRNITLSASTYMAPIRDAINDAIQKEKNDPCSFYNFKRYKNGLENFHWSWPYGITPEELKKLFEEANNEEEFDKLMLSFFSKDRVKQMCEHALELIPRKHKTVFSQIIEAYDHKYYALINNNICSIIDNLLSVVLNNKGLTKRKKILQPIIEYYMKHYRVVDIGFIFELQMLSNNINLIFCDYNFAENIKIKTHKKARRHLSSHGVSFSNKKCDSVMLLNTLTALLDNMKYIEPFKECLVCNNKKIFEIDVKRYVVVVNIIKKQLGIEAIDKKN